MKFGKMIIRELLASSLVAGALGYAGAAKAEWQDQGAGRSAVDQSRSEGLAEIIVTAQRRGENLQDVPISVNALSADQLQAMGGTSSEDLNLIPSVVYSPALSGGGFTLRGISGSNSGADESPNAIYVDGVYQFAPTATLFQFAGIERIEVLKGPQGTLFGRNTAGGLVHIITRDPGRDAGGEARIGYGNYDTVQGSLYLTSPLTSTLSANISAYGFDQKDGWGKNLFTGDDAHKGYSWGVRSKLKWVAPDGDTDVVLSAYYSKDKPASGEASVAPGVLLDPLGQPSKSIYDTNSDLRQYRKAKQYAFAGTIHHDLGFARINSITSYNKVTIGAVIDADATPAPFLGARLNGTYRNFTQELQLQSNEDSRLQWILGAFYMDGKNPGVFDVAQGFLVSHTTIGSKSYAGFGQVTYPITDNTKITAGLRYTSDRHSLYGSQVVAHFFTNTFDKKQTDNKLSWRLAVDHKFSEDVLGYVSYSRGFKSGVFSSTSPETPPATPTTLDAYEVGLKTQTSDRRLRANIAIFYYNYKDMQLELFKADGSGAYFVNGGDARTYGLDLDVAAEPVPNLTLTGGLSLLNSKFTKYDASKPLPPCFTVPSPPATGVIIGSCSIEGNRPPFAPKFTGSVALNYKHETTVGRFDLAGSISHNSGYYTDPSNFELVRARPFETLNASITWTSPGGTFNATIWGKNLLDEHVIGSSGLGNGTSGALVFPLAPLTYGVTLGAKF